MQAPCNACIDALGVRHGSVIVVAATPGSGDAPKRTPQSIASHGICAQLREFASELLLAPPPPDVAKLALAFMEVSDASPPPRL